MKKIYVIALLLIAVSTIVYGANQDNMISPNEGKQCQIDLTNIALTNQTNVFEGQQNFTGSINSDLEINAEILRFPIRLPEHGLSHLIFEQAGRMNMWHLNGTRAIEYFVYAPNQALYLGQNGYPILPSGGNAIDLGNQYQHWRNIYGKHIMARDKITPITNNTADIGTRDLWWGQMYIGHIQSDQVRASGIFVSQVVQFKHIRNCARLGTDNNGYVTCKEYEVPINN